MERHPTLDSFRWVATDFGKERGDPIGTSPLVGAVEPSTWRDSLIIATNPAQPDAWQWLGGADSLTATLLALAAIALGIRAILERTLFRRRLFRRSLDALGTGVNWEYVASLLGPPQLGRLDTQGSGALTWASRHGFVQIVFEAGVAEQIAITVTDPSLRYDISKITRGVFRGQLGRRVAGPGSIESFLASVGARRLECVLNFWGGNPGGYLTHSISYNDASSLGKYPEALLQWGSCAFARGELFSDADLPCPDVELEAQVKEQLIPNTIIVTSNPQLIRNRNFGVDLDSVRLLPRETTWAEKLRSWRLRRRSL